MLHAVSLQAKRAGLLHRDQQLLVQHGVRWVRRQVQAVKTRMSPDRDRKTKTRRLLDGVKSYGSDHSFYFSFFLSSVWKHWGGSRTPARTCFYISTSRFQHIISPSMFSMSPKDTWTNSLTFWVICSLSFLTRGRSDLYRCHVYNSPYIFKPTCRLVERKKEWWKVLWNNYFPCLFIFSPLIS